MLHINEGANKKRSPSNNLTNTERFERIVIESSLRIMVQNPKQILLQLRLAARGLRHIIDILKNYPFCIIPGELLSCLVLAGQMDKIVTSERPHALHSQHLSLRSLVSSIIGKKHGLKIIITAHGYDTAHPRSFKEYILRRRIVELADAVISLTRRKLSFLKSLYDHPEKYVYLPNFIECSDTYDASSSNLFMKQKTRIKNEEVELRRKIVILYLGRIAEKKGIFDILDMLKLLNPNVARKLYIIFAGEGPDEKKLVERIKQINNRNIKFLGTVHGQLKK